jgi:autotransporter-associated beta strand protein
VKTLILSCAIILTPALAALNAVYAGSATWNFNPTNGDWNTANNWTPATVPNGPSDTATFSSSGVTDVSISAGVEVDGIVFDSGAKAFTISNQPGVALTISGAGIANNSGVLHNFVNQEGPTSAGQLYFTNGATAGDAVIYTNQTVEPSGTIFPLIQFEDSSTAGGAQFINMAGGGFARAGVIEFQGNSTAGNGTFQNTGVSGPNSPQINFRDQASAGEAVITNEKSTSSYVNFYDNSTADHATITNEAHFGAGFVFFHNNSTAGSATIINEGDTTWDGNTYFYDTSTAGDGTFIVDGSLSTDMGFGGRVDFWANSKAGNGTFIVNAGQVPGAGGGVIYLNNFSSAENGTFYVNGGLVSGAFGGRVIFDIFDSTAATATLIANGGVGSGVGEGGGILFQDNSVGAQARVELFGNGFLDIRGHDTPELTIGSLEGDGLVFLGGANLSVGSNNLSTTFSGVIDEASEGTTGALTKIGRGILMLTGANTYTGGTAIEGGKLVVNNRTGSGTGTGAVQVNAGILAGRGTIAGTVIVGTGSGAGAALAPGRRGAKTDTLTILGALTFQLDSTYKFELKSSTTAADKVVANGVTITGALFSFTDLGSGMLPTGTVFTVIDNTAATLIAGTFANLPDDSTITIGSNTFQANYEGGDGNDLTLIVVP